MRATRTGTDGHQPEGPAGERGSAPGGPNGADGGTYSAPKGAGAALAPGAHTIRVRSTRDWIASFR